MGIAHPEAGVPGPRGSIPAITRFPGLMLFSGLSLRSWVPNPCWEKPGLPHSSQDQALWGEAWEGLPGELAGAAMARLAHLLAARLSGHR